MSLPDSKLEASSRLVFVQKQAANIYTMMLILAFLFVTLGCLFLYLEMRAYNMSVKVPSEARVPPPPTAMFHVPQSSPPSAHHSAIPV